MLPVVLHIVLVAGAATLLAFWCGWWMSRLLLPSSLMPWGGLLAPLMGYSLLLVVGYWLVRDFTGLTALIAILLPGSGVLNAVAWRKTGPPSIRVRVERHIPLALLILTTFAVGVMPLVSYGYAGIIGANWDVENYLPVSRYLERGPVSAISEAAPNPLRDLNSSPPEIGLTLGFSIIHGSVNLLTGQEAISTFAIMLAWLRALGVAAVYILLRATMGLEREWALFGAAMTGAGSLLLWVSYFNFGMQIAAWPLLGLGLVLGMGAIKEVAVRHRAAWPSLVGAAVALAALPVAYYPALTLFVPLAAGLGAALLLASAFHRTEQVELTEDPVHEPEPSFSGSSRKAVLYMIGGAAALLAGVLALSVPAIYDYLQGFSFRYGQQLTSLGLFRYVPVTDFAGLSTFELRGDPIVPPFAWVGFVFLSGLIVAGLILSRRRALWLGLAAGAVAYMVWLRLEDYPYAWMKGGAYAAFPFLGLAAAGAQSLSNHRWPRFMRVGTTVAALALLLLMAIAQGQTVASTMRSAGLFERELPEMLALRQSVPAGSTVRLSSDPRVRGVRAALPAYLLDHTEVVGATNTGYVPFWQNGAPDELADYALLLAEEDPELWGYSMERMVWKGGGYRLYSKEPGYLAHLRYDKVLSAGETATLSVGEDRLSASEVEGTKEKSADRHAVMRLASLSGGEVAIGGSAYRLEAGLTTLGQAVSVPHELEIKNLGSTPLWVRDVKLIDPSKSGSRLVEGPILGTSMALIQAQSIQASNRVTITAAALMTDSGPLTIALDIWDNRRGAHYGWYGYEQFRTEVSRTVQFSLDLETGKMNATDSEGRAVPFGGGLDRVGPGDYTARLNLIAGTVVTAAPEDLFSFTMGPDGDISNLSVLQDALTVAVTIDRPTTPLEVSVGADTRLLGYAIPDGKIKPGDEVPITIWWQAMKASGDERSILIHLLDANGRKVADADGPPASGGRPTMDWRAGEVVIDMHRVKIPSDIGEGDYYIAIGMYRYPSLERLSMEGGIGTIRDNLVQLPVRVER